jgi:hypothetical protein
MKAERIDEKTKNDIRRGIYYEIYEDHSKEGKGLIKVGEGNGFATTNFYDMLQTIFSNGGTGWDASSSPASGVLDTTGSAIASPSVSGYAYLYSAVTATTYMQVGSDTTTKTTLATYALASPYSTTADTTVPNRITASTTNYWSNASISATFDAGFIANGSTIGEIGLVLEASGGDDLIDRIAVADGSFTAITYNSAYPLVITVTFSGF